MLRPFSWAPFIGNCGKVNSTEHEIQYPNKGIYFSRIPRNWIYMCMDKHLTEQELAQYVEALVLEKQGQLPENMREHVADCFQCKVEILGVWELVEPVGSSEFVD